MFIHVFTDVTPAHFFPSFVMNLCSIIGSEPIHIVRNNTHRHPHSVGFSSNIVYFFSTSNSSRVCVSIQSSFFSCTLLFSLCVQNNREKIFHTLSLLRVQIRFPGPTHAMCIYNITCCHIFRL